MGRFEPFADNRQMPKLLPAASRRRLGKNSTPIAPLSQADHIRPRRGARRVCPPQRRTIAAAGSGRMPNAPTLVL
jgi:hypothetical protein